MNLTKFTLTFKYLFCFNFKLEFDKGKYINPTLAAVRLVNPHYSTATNLVIADYNSKEKYYYAVIDLGDPVKIIYLSKGPYIAILCRIQM